MGHTGRFRAFLGAMRPTRDLVGVARSLYRSVNRGRPTTDPDLDPAAHPIIERAYRELLGRPADPAGLAHYSRLAEEVGVGEVLLQLARSSEHVHHVVEQHCPLPDIRAGRPHCYRTLQADDGRQIEVFEVSDERDVDWVLGQILDRGYYERPASWSQEMNEDKRTMAEIIAGLGGGRILEIGCSTGLILDLLREQGLDVAGVELSRRAAEAAPPAMRDRIHVGDFLDGDLAGDLDVVYGLDVFEHVHPRQLPAWFARASSLLRPGGLLFANIPAFGPDPVFGEVFPMWFPEWRDDAAAGRPFRHLEVDRSGFPAMGHLVWATWEWWTAAIEEHGFRRDHGREHRIQAQFRNRLEDTPGRLSLFVFEKATAG